MNEHAFEPMDYTELPVVGFLLDGRRTGFKTAVVQNGREPAVQDADGEGIVRGFVRCGEDDIERIYRPNYPIGRISRVGRELIFVFQTRSETYYGPKSRLVSRLLVAARDAGEMSDTDVISVMVFARLSASKIFPRIDDLAKNLADKGVPGAGEWAASFKSRVSAKLSLESPADVKETNFLSLTAEDLEAAAQSEIESVEDAELKEAALKILDSYFSAKSSLMSGSLEVQDSGQRDLFSLSAQVDDLGFKNLSFLINYYFVKIVWQRFIRWNSKKYGRKIRIEMPYSDLARVARLDASERLIELVRVFSLFKPFVHRSPNGRQMYLPPGLLVAGDVKAKGKGGEVQVEAGKQLIEITGKLQSVSLFHSSSPVGNTVLFTIISRNNASCRGLDFVKSVMEIFYPTLSDKDNPMEIIAGASNSWIVTRSNFSKVSRFISGQGVYSEQIKEICGLRRVTSILRSDDIDRAIRDFCKVSWRELVVKREGEGYVLSLISEGEAAYFDERKYRTFKAMWKKLFPRQAMKFMYRESVGAEWQVVG